LIDKIILGAVLGIVGYSGLFPDPPQPLTPAQLRVKAKEASKSAVCNKSKKQSKTVKQLCKKWEKDD
jgi:hypothetical protein